MRLAEMSESQRQSHHGVVSTLVAAGWEPQRDQLAFEEGEWTVYDIDMQRSNGRTRLRVFRDPATDELSLTIVMAEGVLGLYFKCEARFGETVRAIVGMQDDIDVHTYKRKVASLLRVCPEIYVGTDERSRIRLVDKKGYGNEP
jgi:hypothetical protein